MNFKQLELSEPIQQALMDVGYTQMTDIQQQAIPKILNNQDVLGCAQTGTGKTAAFAVPIIQKTQNSKRRDGIQALVLTPTRELAIQIDEQFKAYSKHLHLTSLAIFGGVPQGKQTAILKKGVTVLIATPGRLLDLMQQKIVSLSTLKILVLDEADHMLDIGFIHDIKRILKQVPSKRQTLFFSATMPPAIRQFAKSIQKNPVEVSVAPVSSAAETVQQSVYFVEKKEKPNLLINLLKGQDKDQSLVFTRTKFGADKLVRQLMKSGIRAAAIHGNKSQNNRQNTLNAFKSNKLRVLVATDIAARGIDIEQLPFVVNYELPDVPETYVHRIGRTGRAGQEGVAISFCQKDQKKQLQGIQKLIGFKLPVKETQKSLN